MQYHPDRFMYTAAMIRAASIALLSITLASVLVMGSLTHALIPHAHSHSHTSGEGVMWQSLHSSLRHEDKSTFFALLAVIGVAFVVWSFISVLLHAVRVSAMRLDGLIRSIADPYRGRLLSRGIHQYRRFA